MPKSPVFPRKIDTSTLGGRILAIRKALNLTQKELAQYLQTSRELIRDLESGRTKGISAKLAHTFRVELNVNPDYLVAGVGPMFLDETVPESEVRELIIYGQISAGAGVPPYNDVQGTVKVDKKVCSERAFALKVEGDSMEPLIMNGDVVLIEPVPAGYVPKSGTIVAVLDKEDWDTAKIKRIRHWARKGKKEVVLESLNPAYEPHYTTWNNIHIYGVVFEVRRRVEPLIEDTEA